MKRILFVCTGNTCRSSMAEALLRYLLQENQLQYYYAVESAGTYANEQEPASYNSVLALKEMGVDLSAHASKAVTKEMLEKADLILTMTRTHKEVLKMIDSTIEPKLYTLKDYCCGKAGDICDPFGGDLEIYKLCRDEIMDNLIKLIEILKQNQQ